MKNFKRIIATVLTAMMMLAMSVTAFAAENTTITVTNLSDSENTKVSIYLIAEINQDKWDFSEWAEDACTLSEGATEYTFDYAALKSAIEAQNSKAVAEQTLTTENGATSLIFNNVKAGAYFVLATGENTTYQAMVAKTYGYDANDKFTAKAASLVAKSETTTVVKKTDDTFVAADQLVTFTVETEIPYVAENAQDKSFIVYDKPENLKDMTLVKVKMGCNEVAATMSDKDDNGVYAIDLTDYAKDENVGKKVVITLTAVVDGANGYVNTAWSNRNDDITDYNIVKGYTASIDILKVDATNTNNPLSGAKFKFTLEDANGTNEVKFLKENDGVYVVSKADNAAAEVEVDANGKLMLKGLSEGIYHVTETQAPEGYAINKNIPNFVIDPTGETDKNTKVYADTTRLDVPEATAHINLSGDACKIKDSKLSSLPFTGGVGTTIFTVLGVAIMALAAALFFASTRKTASK